MELARFTYRIGQSHPILVTRKAGETVRKEIAAFLAAHPASVVQLDFAAVEIIDYSFADEAVAKTVRRLQADEWTDTYIVLTNLRPEWEENVAVALTQRQLAALTASDGRWKVTGALKEHLHQALAFVVAQHRATARDLAAAYGLGVGAANNRLAELSRLKLLSRTDTIPPGGGRQFVYDSLV